MVESSDLAGNCVHRGGDTVIELTQLDYAILGVLRCRRGANVFEISAEVNASPEEVLTELRRMQEARLVDESRWSRPPLSLALS